MEKGKFYKISMDLITGVELNPNSMSEHKFEHLKKTIQDRGFMQPITVAVMDGRYTIIDGHHRFKAMKDLGHDEIDAYVMDGKTELDVKVDLYNMNRTRGEFSHKKSLALLNSISADMDLEKMYNLMDLDKRELKDMLTIEEDSSADPFVKNIDERKEPKYKVKKGQIWQLGRHRLMCGDATNLEHTRMLLENKNANMAFTDPPYNVNIGWNTATRFKQREGIENDDMDRESFKAMVEGFMRVLFQVCPGPHYIFMSCKDWATMMSSYEELGGHWSSTIIWNKDHFCMGRKDYQPKFEPILYGWTEGAKVRHFEERNKSDVWDFVRPKASKLHPTMKPIDLIAEALHNSSNIGDTILDSFGGSGSTLIACENLGRSCRMMEIDPFYCSVIMERWEHHTNGTAKLLPEGGE